MNGWGFDVRFHHPPTLRASETERIHVVSLKRAGKIWMRSIYWQMPNRVQHYYTIGPMKWALDAYVDRRAQCT